MPNVLFAWEIGGGFGHAGLLASLARRFAARGFTPVFAGRNVPQTWTVTRTIAPHVLQTPLWRERPWQRATALRARSYCDILTWNGWDDPVGLESLLRSWDALFDLVQPSLVVADHAPTMLLAAHGWLPAVQTGNGFCLPPSHLPEFPVLNADIAHLQPPAVLLEAIAQVQRLRARPAPATLTAVFDAPRFLACLEDFDPYRDLRREPFLGPIEPLPRALPPAADPRWFAYFGAEGEGVDEVLVALAGSGLPGQAYLRGATPQRRDWLRSRGVTLQDQPLAQEAILAGHSIIAHGGGTGLASAALAAGRAQLLVPRNLEQRLAAKRLEDRGVALVVRPDGDFRGAILRLAREKTFVEAAGSAAARIHAQGLGDCGDRIVDSCLALLGGPGKGRA